MKHASPLTPERWILDLFSSVAARSGGVIRRKRRDIERYAGLELFKHELNRRGYRALENTGQIIIFCNQEDVRPLSLKESAPETLQVSGTGPFKQQKL